MDELLGRKLAKTGLELCAPSLGVAEFGRFASKRFIVSNTTQKIFDRAFKELSNDVFSYLIQSIFSELKLIELVGSV